MNRLFVTTADIKQLTGNQDNYCRRTMNRIKDQLGKKRYQHITFAEYADYEGVNIQDVLNCLKIKTN